MRERFAIIISQLAAAKCSVPLAQKLRSKKLISEQVYEEAVNFAVVESKRIGCMIDAVLAKVQLNTEHYSTFIKILEEIGGMEDLIQLLQVWVNKSYIDLLHALFKYTIQWNPSYRIPLK